LVTPAGTAERGHFLTFETQEAGRVHDTLAAAGIMTDVRGDRIRFGFGCYHTQDDIRLALVASARALRP
jgi:kynureninase